MSAAAPSSLRDHYDRVYRFLRRKTGDRDQAEELTQETFASAAAALARTEAREPLALLFSIASRRFADEARRRSRAPVSLPIETVHVEARPPEYGAGIVATLRVAIARLSAEQRDVVVWKLFEGRSFAEIARRTGASEAACKMRFRRGLSALRSELEKEGVEP